MRRAVVIVAVLAVATSACTSAKNSSATSTTGQPSTTSTTPSTTSTTQAAADGAVAALPVVPCPTSYAAGNNPHPFVPNELPAAVPARGLRFYSNGLMTVLGPAGWACSALVAADGGELLDVYPPGQPDLSVTVISPGSQVVQLEVDYTGHGPGAGLICPLFPDSPAATFESGLPCPTLPPAESTLRLTDDVVAFSDPPGVRGTGAGSGGPLRSLGDAVYPQVKPAEPPGGVTVAVLSCTLASNVDPLCMSIQADFLVRQAPVYKGSQG